MITTFKYRFTSTLEDLLDAEEVDMTAATVRRWMRSAISIIGLFMVITGLLEVGSPEEGWTPVLRTLAGFLLLYYLFFRSWIRRRRIRKENTASQELVLEFRDEYVQIEASGQGTFRREWSELLDFVDVTGGVLLYFDDGIVNWLPDRVFEDNVERTAFVEFLRSHTSQ